MSSRRAVLREAAVMLASVGLLAAACSPAPPTIAPATAGPTASPTTAATATAPPLPPTAAPVSVHSIDAQSAARLAMVATLAGHTGPVTALAFAPDGTWLASSSQDASIRLWQASGRWAARRLEGHTDVVWSLAFSPDGGRLISGSDDRSVRVWEIPTGRLVDTIRSASFGRALQVAYSPDGVWIAAADQFCLVQVRSARTGVLYRSLMQPACSAAEGNIVEAWGLAFTPDGTRLLAAEAEPCCWGTVQSWDLEDYRDPERVQGPNGGVRAMALSPDGETLALAFASCAIPWIVEADSGELLHELHGHAYAVRDLAISPDGQLLATASADRTVRVWDVRSGELLATLTGHAAAVDSVAFSPDGSRLVSGDDAGLILVWGVDLQTPE